MSNTSCVACFFCPPLHLIFSPLSLFYLFRLSTKPGSVPSILKSHSLTATTQFLASNTVWRFRQGVRLYYLTTTMSSMEDFPVSSVQVRQLFRLVAAPFVNTAALCGGTNYGHRIFTYWSLVIIFTTIKAGIPKSSEPWNNCFKTQTFLTNDHRPPTPVILLSTATASFPPPSATENFT